MENTMNTSHNETKPTSPKLSGLSIGQVFTSATTIPLIDARSGEITHSVKESYHCPQCSFSTAWKSSLSIHLKTHTDERPWQCALCNKHFKLKHHLKHHILTHSTSKPFKCNLCNYKTADNRNMQKHKYNKHRITLKRRGGEKLTLPTMVPGSHADYDAVNPFTEQGINSSQSVTSTPLSTPSFQGSIASPIFQSPTSFNIASTSQTPWPQKSPDNYLQQNTVLLGQNPLESRQTDTSNSLFRVMLGHDNASDALRMSSPLNVSIIKEGLAEAREKRKSLNSERSFDMSQSGKIPDSPSQSSMSAETGTSNICNRQKYSTVESDASDTPVSPPEKSKEPVTKSQEPTASNCWKCKHCQIIFPDKIMYGLHMGCHSVTNEYQCNICGAICLDKHDFMFHFTIGKHQN
uniref:Zinc finger protein Pegasus n=1 Tax=Phallusia mammillata TaxID=59560 RepID=A0A6F9DEE1_9ASCI|nr:zinc finger protein Pegasus [Phallusia mammillata]